MAVMTVDQDAQLSSTADNTPIPARSWVALVVLFTVYLLNYLDRTLIYILFGPIKAEMKLSDLELALLGSTSFVIFYTILGVPFGRLADRVVRKKMIAVGLIIWSVFSGLTGFMHDFLGIFLCRVMVGVGEATLGPAALSLLSDLFPPRMRATVGAIYSAGIPVGAGVALTLGGVIHEAYGWRWAFYLLGFPGVALAVMVLLMQEPARGTTEGNAAATAAPPGAWKVLFQTRALWFHYLGYALFAVAGTALSMWMPSFMAKAFQKDLAYVGSVAGFCAAVGGFLGTMAGGWTADRFRARSRGGRMLFTALAAAVCVPLWLFMLNAQDFWFMVAPYFVLMAMALMWLGPAAADVQDVVGPQLRGLGVGVYFFIVNVIGYGIAPPLIGRISDALGVTQDPNVMRTSLLVCPAACVLSAALLWLGGREMNRSQRAA